MASKEGFRGSAIERFTKKVEKTGTCWLWRGAISSSGYGMVRAPGVTYAHRWAYEHFVGQIAEGLDIDHHCRVRHCVNPMHLEPVTRSVNVGRGWSARKAAL